MITSENTIHNQFFIMIYTRVPSGLNRDMRECSEKILKRSPRYQYIVFEYDKEYLITNFNQKYILAQEIVSGNILEGELALGQTIFFLKGIKFWKVHEYIMFKD